MRAAAAMLMAACALTACGLNACATELTPTAVDTRSPVAARVAREAGRPATMPSLGSIPARPVVPTVAQYDTTVTGQRGQGAALQQWFVDHPRMSGDTDAFALEARAAVAPAGAALTPEQVAESAAYAARARAAAVPPPPPR